MNLFQAMEKLNKDKSKNAVFQSYWGKCYLKWIDKSNGTDKYKQLAYINVNGYENFNFLTDNFTYLNFDGWEIL